MMQVVATTSLVSSNANFMQMLDTATFVMGALSFMGMVFIFVYKNRMMILAHEKDIERERRDRMEALAAHREKIVEMETRHAELEREVTELKIVFARVKGELGVKS